MITNWENWPKENEDDLFFCIFEVGGDQLMGGLFLNEVPDVSGKACQVMWHSHNIGRIAWHPGGLIIQTRMLCPS